MESNAKYDKILQEKLYAIQNLRQTIEQYDKEIESIHAEADENDEMRALTEKQAMQDKNPRSIAAMDALDTIMRLESTLKIVDQRNAMIQKDNQIKDKLLRDYGKRLEKVTKEEEDLIETTGYHKGKADTGDVDAVRLETEKVIEIKNEIAREMVAAELVIKKKQQLLAKLNEEIEGQIAKENDLCQIYNDIRVVDRECKEEAKLHEELKIDFDKMSMELALVTEQSGALVAIDALSKDNEYLKNSICQYKEEKSRYEKVMSDQLARTRQLQERLDIIMAAIRDMKMEKDLERQISKDMQMPVPVSSDDAMDADRIAPKEEMIPVEMYELLHRDQEAMRSIADRKAILVTEKTCTIDAQMSTIATFYQQMEMTNMQQGNTRVNNRIEQNEAVLEVTRQVSEFRTELGKLVNENARLKAIYHDIEAKKKAEKQTAIVMQQRHSHIVY